MLNAVKYSLLHLVDYASLDVWASGRLLNRNGVAGQQWDLFVFVPLRHDGRV
jgi:hypothetical protein